MDRHAPTTALELGITKAGSAGFSHSASCDSGALAWEGQHRVGALDVKTFLAQQKRSVEFQHVESAFTMVLGQALPWVQPNIDTARDEMAQIANLVPDASDGGLGMATACCCTGILAPYVCCKTHLVHKGHIAFATNAGHPALLRPGWNFLAAPWNCYANTFQMSDSVIRNGPVTIVRIPEGYIGTAQDNTTLQLLLPGTHVRNNALFRFHDTHSLAEPLIKFGQIKFFTIPTGFVQVCYLNGAVIPLTEGRYAINMPSFQIGPEVDVRQENLKFDRHNVMLDGGVTLECEGLLTYQIVDPVLLVKNMGTDDVERALQDVTKAELAKVFASVYLEQLSGLRTSEIKDNKSQGQSQLQSKELDLLTDSKESSSGSGSSGGAVSSASSSSGKGNGKAVQREEDWQEKQHDMTRMRICATVEADIAPLCQPWGVKIIKFQLETTRLADKRFGADYEAATLSIAKAKATLKSNAAENLVLIQQAQAKAMASTIEAEAAKATEILRAQGRAEAMRIEANARQTAATTMSDSFGKQMAFIEQQTKMVAGLKATTLILGDKAHPLLPIADLPMPNA